MSTPEKWLDEAEEINGELANLLVKQHFERDQVEGIRARLERLILEGRGWQQRQEVEQRLGTFVEAAMRRLERIADALENPPAPPAPEETDDDPERQEVWATMQRLAHVLETPAEEGTARASVRPKAGKPEIWSVDPSEAARGEEVTLRGKELHGVVTVGVDWSRATVVRQTPEELRFVVPKEASRGSGRVVDVDGAEATFQLKIVAAPAPF
jgi:hypothetical protein